MKNIPERANGYQQRKSSDIHLTLLLIYDSFFSIIPNKFGDLDNYKFTLFSAHDMSPSHIVAGDEDPMNVTPTCTLELRERKNQAVTNYGAQKNIYSAICQTFDTVVQH
jgi:hypothetical protein